MSWSELSRLKPVAPSMGMMLETTSRRLSRPRALRTTAARTRIPKYDLRTLADAGRLSIPFTTGLLVGIGETLVEARRDDPRDSLLAQGIWARFRK